LDQQRTGHWDHVRLGHRILADNPVEAIVRIDAAVRILGFGLMDMESVLVEDSLVELGSEPAETRILAVVVGSPEIGRVLAEERSLVVEAIDSLDNLVLVDRNCALGEHRSLVVVGRNLLAAGYDRRLRRRNLEQTLLNI